MNYNTAITLNFVFTFTHCVVNKLFVRHRGNLGAA